MLPKILRLKFIEFSMLNYKYIYFQNILVRIVKFEFINLY